MIKFEVHYQTHSYPESWEPLPDMYCPSCGRKAVWHEMSGGDYYVGETHLCRSCGAEFYMPSLTEGNETRLSYDAPQYRQRMAQLRCNLKGYEAVLAELGVAAEPRPPTEMGLLNPAQANRFLKRLIREGPLTTLLKGRRP